MEINIDQKSKLLLKNISQAKLQEQFIALGLPKYRAEQVFRAIYSDRVKSFDEITTLPKDLRLLLNENYEFEAFASNKFQTSVDGTVKFLFRLRDGEAVETVIIPETNPDSIEKMRNTICVSSQVGCALNCSFCATGKIKFKRNLSAGEIVDQFLQAEQITGKKITNIVFMGMGEPMQNLKNVISAIDILTAQPLPLVSERRITISTSGIVPRMLELADMNRSIKLALSLHATTDELRKNLMPIAEKWFLKDIIDAMENYYRKTGVPLTYEYIMFDGLNDTEADAKRLIKIARRAPSRINIIPYHDISFTKPEGFAAELKPANLEKINDFIKLLRNFEVNAFLRTSSGFDIDAACGQLALSDRAVSDKS